MAYGISELVQHHELLWTWTWRGIQVRYKQTALGGLWAILQPLSLMVVFSVVFTRFVRVDTGGIPYPIFSYTAILPWTFFSSAITAAVTSLVDNMHLVTKIYFPREIFPLAAIGSRLVDFLIASIVFIGMVFFYDIGVNVMWMWLPIVLTIQLVLTVGISLAGAALNVFYRDVRHAIMLVMQLWMYATPIIYPITMVPEQYQTLYSLNPMVGIIESYRYTVLQGQSPPLPLLLYSAVSSTFVLIMGYWYFKRVEPQFGDII